MKGRFAAALVAAALVSSGCSSSASGPTGSITVFAAASLTSTFTQLGKDFEAAHPGTTVRFSFGPSSGLAQQLLAGAPGDVFASASTKNMKQVLDAGAADDAQEFATNLAEIAAGPHSRVTRLADLAARGVRVALCAPQVPCGALALKVLGKAHLAVKPVTQGLDVKSTLAYVTTGQVDAAIVYVTDVLGAGSKVSGVEIPAAVNASTAYEVATVRTSRHAVLAMAFEEYLLSPAGRAVLMRAGFRKP